MVSLLSNDVEEERGLGGTLAYGPIQTHASQVSETQQDFVLSNRVACARLQCQQCSHPQVLIRGTSAET